MGTRHKLLVLVPVFIVFVTFKVLTGGSFCRMPLWSSALYYILGVPVHKQCNFCCFLFFHFCIYASVVYSYFCAGNATSPCFRGPSTRARPDFLNWDIWNKLCLSSQITIFFFCLFIAFVFFMRLELVNCGVVREWLPWTWLKMSAWSSGQWAKD